MHRSLPLVLLAVLVTLTGAARADQSPPAVRTPWYVDDDQFLDDFTEKLADLAADGKCLSPDEIKKKTEGTRTCTVKPTAAGETPLAPEEVYRRAVQGVFVIGCVKKPDKPGGGYTDGWFGTAWAVAADGILVTNWHMFDNPDGMAFGAVNHKGDVFPVTDILAVDRRADVAVVKVAGSGFTPLPVAVGPAEVGAWVGVLSHPGNQPFTFTQGAVTRYATNFGGPDAFGERWMGITADYAGGSSGGPVLNRYGAVVGMACLTSNIDHEEGDVPPADEKPKDEPKNRRADRPKADPPAESRIQMVVKLAVPVTLIRKAIAAPLDGRDPAAADPGDLTRQATALRKRFERSEQKLTARLKAAEDADADRLIQQLDDLRAGYAHGLLRLTETAPADPRAVPVLTDAVILGGGDTADRALDLLTRHHAKSDRLANVILWLGADASAAGETFLKAVVEANPHRPCKGAAVYTLGLLAKQRAKDAEEDDRAVARAEAAKHFAEVQAKYADVKPDGSEIPLGVLVRKPLAGLKNLPNLEVGKAAPEVVGVDLDGRPMKLSDYRGKVVLLDFWGFT